MNLKDQAHRDKTMGLKPRKTIDNITDARIIQMVKFQIQTQTAQSTNNNNVFWGLYHMLK